jgi:predicted Zn-dependent peptidase
MAAATAAAARRAQAAPRPPPTSLSAPVDALLLPYAEALAKRVVEFSLPNGLRFVVLERRGATGAPVVSVCTHADVGAFDEPDGSTGLAHLLEHMAFKGTEAVGRLAGVSAEREAALMAAEDAAFYDLRDLRAAGAGKAAIAAADARLAAAVAAAAAVTEPNAWGAAIQRAGGRGLNAATSHDATRYFVSLPANALELWFALEAARFRAPVFRGLYAEKRVVAEERRARVDAAPLGSFQQRFARAALASNYGRPVIGYAADVEAVGRAELASFFRERYGPASLAIAVVGDASPARVRALAERYFGGWDSGGVVAPPPSSPAPTARPADPVPRVTAADRAGPLVMQAYYRPSDANPALAAAVEAACGVLHGSRSARLYRSLVLPGVALGAQAVAAFPGDKRPCATLLAATPAAGVDPDIVADALAREGLRLAADGPTADEVSRVRRTGLVSLYSAFRSNAGLAGALAAAAAAKGTWRALLDEVTAADGVDGRAIGDAAGSVFAADGNCTTGVVEAAAERVTIAPALTF